MVISRTTVVKWALFIGVMLLCIWYLLERWPVDADVPWSVEQPTAPEAPTVAVEDGTSDDEEDYNDLAVFARYELADEDFFIDTRLERERTYSRHAEYLNEIANNDRMPAEAQKQAASDLRALMERRSLETEVETLIRSKGFDDAIAYLTESVAVVVVKCETLDEAGVACLSELIMTMTGIAPERISIVHHSHGG